MPAPDYATCFNVRDSILTAVHSVLSGALTPTVLKDFDGSEKTTPRVEANLELGEPTGHYGKDQAGVFIRDAWKSSLTCKVCTNRKKSAQSGVSAATIAAIREALQNYQDAFNTSVLPYHSIVDLRESGSVPRIDAGSDEDEDSISYEFISTIRATAWPDV